MHAFIHSAGMSCVPTVFPHNVIGTFMKQTRGTVGVSGQWGLIWVRYGCDIKKAMTHMINDSFFFNSDYKGRRISAQVVDS